MEPSANTPTLMDVVRSLDEISVGDYQRTYAWQSQQIDDLFTDIKNCVTDEGRHFLGSLIFHQTGTRKAELVDGQQRLTTVFVIVARLRDALAEIGLTTIEAGPRGQMPIDVRGIAWEFLYFSRKFEDKRFRSNRFIRDQLMRMVIAEPQDRPELPERDNKMTLAFRKAVWQIEKLVRKDLADYSTDEDKLERIYKLLDTLLNKFVVLQVRTGTLAESLDIFLTLNNRGLPLGQSDLVRGEVMMQRGAGETDRHQLHLFEEILTEWQGIEEAVREPEVFLHHFMLATAPKSITKKKVHEAVSRRIASPDAQVRKAKADDFWRDICNAADLYGRIVEPSDMSDESAYRIQLLEGLTKSHRVILLGGLLSGVSGDDWDELVRLVWVLSYRWVMSGGNAQEIQDFYQECANELRDSGDCMAVLEGVRARIAPIELDAQRHLRVEGDSSFATRAILHATNRALVRGANPIALDSKLHIEHIAPQASTPDWIEALFEGDPGRVDEYDDLVSQAGNLTLLDFKLNNQAKRKLLHDKHPFYNRSVMQISRDLVRLDNWTDWYIRQRTAWLAECFELLWDVDGPREVRAFPEWLEEKLTR